MCSMAFTPFSACTRHSAQTLNSATQIAMRWQVAGLWCAVRLRPAGAPRVSTSLWDFLLYFPPGLTRPRGWPRRRHVVLDATR